MKSSWPGWDDGISDLQEKKFHTPISLMLGEFVGVRVNG
jgi:hypothetical protein